MWNPDKYMRAWNFACARHAGQKVPGSNLPYVNHVGNVAMEVLVAVVAEEFHYSDLAVQCALLHDTVEDTETSLEEIQAIFGDDVAAGVSALTKSKDFPDKRSGMLDSLKRIKQCPREVWIVKLADRVVNLQPPPHYWTVEKIAAYRAEAELILNELGDASEVLGKRLRGKIDGYEY
ncbi:HD domain-containing protein [Maridesulfovibrio sp. FT414]|uniref:HD domain-containing protein n=1 Tax=Maridesulfovibrio sp. FT414 TaxID=2979469 RepID=UPI003D807627